MPSNQQQHLSPPDSKVSKHVCTIFVSECYRMTERWFRQWSLIRTWTCGWRLQKEVGSVLLIDLRPPSSGHSSRMAILHFSLANQFTSRTINLQRTICVSNSTDLCPCASLHGCVRLCSPRFPALLNNSAAFLCVWQYQMKLQVKSNQKQKEAEESRYWWSRDEKINLLLLPICSLSNVISSHLEKKMIS